MIAHYFIEMKRMLLWPAEMPSVLHDICLPVWTTGTHCNPRPEQAAEEAAFDPDAHLPSALRWCGEARSCEFSARALGPDRAAPTPRQSYDRASRSSVRRVHGSNTLLSVFWSFYFVAAFPCHRSHVAARGSDYSACSRSEHLRDKVQSDKSQ